MQFINLDELISCSRDKTIKLWNLNNGFCIKTFYGHDDWVRRISINNNIFASCGNETNILVWDKNKDHPIQTLAGHEHVVECVEFIISEKSKKLIMEWKKTGLDKVEFLLSGSRDKTLRLWNIGNG